LKYDPTKRQTSAELGYFWSGEWELNLFKDCIDVE
jgi:hypothetical protein